MKKHGKLFQVRMPGGRRVTRRFRNAAAGARWLALKLQERDDIRAGIIKPQPAKPEPPKPQELALIIHIRAFIVSQRDKRKATSFAPMKGHLRFWRRKLGRLPLEEVRAAAIADALDKLQRTSKLSNATRNRYRSSLFTFFQWADKRDLLVNGNPVRKVDPEPERGHQVRPSGCWDRAEYAERYIATAAQDGLMWEAIAELWVFKGPRVGELAAYQRKDLDLEAGTIWTGRIIDRETREPAERIKNFREGGGYPCPLLPRVQNALTRYLMSAGPFAPDDYLFCLKPTRARGRARPFISPEHLRKKHYEWCSRAGVPRVRPHGIRHFFVTDGQKSGMSLKDMQAMVGHKSSLTTEIYTKLQDMEYLAGKAARTGFGQSRPNVIPLRREA
jgi:integrase